MGVHSPQLYIQTLLEKLSSRPQTAYMTFWKQR